MWSLVTLFCLELDTWGGCLRSKAQVLTEVLQLFLAGRCRLEVTSGTIRARCLPRVYQWNIHPDTSASSWRGLFLPPHFWEVWKGDTPMLTLLCPTCHLTFMLDVSSPATAVQSPPTLMPNMMHCLNLWLRTWAREKKSSQGAVKELLQCSPEINGELEFEDFVGCSS